MYLCIYALSIYDLCTVSMHLCICVFIYVYVYVVCIMCYVVSHIQRIGCQPEKTTLHGSGQSRSWSAEQGKEKQKRKSGSAPPPPPPAKVCMYVFIYMVITCSRVWIYRVRLPFLLVVSSTGKLNSFLPPFAPENSVLRYGFGRPVPL